MKRTVAILNLILLVTHPLLNDARAAGQDSTACLDTARSLLSRKQRITLWRIDGTPIRGDYLAIDEAARSISLNVYDSGNDRFGRGEIPGSMIERIEWTETTQSVALPIVFVAILGGLGFALGRSIQKDPDYGTRESREEVVALLTGVGVVTGFSIGFLISLAGRKSTQRTINCQDHHRDVR